MVTEQRQAIRHFGYDSPLTQEIVMYYENIAPRDGDVAIALALAGNPRGADVLEVGSSLGREAGVIQQYTPNYTGIEQSPDLVRYARQRLPGAHFICADPLEYAYERAAYDVVFAFSSLRYYAKDDMAALLRNIGAALRPGGVLYLSLNYGEHYREELRHDTFGDRTIVLYNPELIMKLAGTRYKKMMEQKTELLGHHWFELALGRA